MGKWTKETALAFVSRNGVGATHASLLIGSVGIATWGAIDYLVKHHGFYAQKAKERH